MKHKDFGTACADIQKRLLAIDKRVLKMAKRDGFDGCADLLVGHIRAALALMDPTYRRLRANKSASPFVRQAYLEDLLRKLGCRGLRKPPAPRPLPIRPPDPNMN